MFRLLLLLILPGLAPPVSATDTPADSEPVQFGVRPYYLIDKLSAGALKTELSDCLGQTPSRSAFSIGHRGAPLQFPEHTRESYLAAARQGAGLLECDVTFTQDRQLVCRHSQCDLHTTTDILTRPELAAKCSVPFTPARTDPQTGAVISNAEARCCTSDITLAEFLTLNGKMDAANPEATTVEDYLNGTANWRTDLYSPGTVMSHAQSIELFKALGVKMIPELKAPEVTMPFQGDYTQQDYADQLINDYRTAGVTADKVYPQSFSLEDVLYWIDTAPEFGAQAVLLDDRYSQLDNFDPDDPTTWQPEMDELPVLAELPDQGVTILAPPLWMLLSLDDTGNIVPSAYAQAAREAGLTLFTWTLERSGPLQGGGGWYYQSIQKAIDDDSDMLRVLDVLARQVGVKGVFSDWPATVTFYANCRGL